MLGIGMNSAGIQNKTNFCPQKQNRKNPAFGASARQIEKILENQHPEKAKEFIQNLILTEEPAQRTDTLLNVFKAGADRYTRGLKEEGKKLIQFSMALIDSHKALLEEEAANAASKEHAISVIA